MTSDLDLLRSVAVTFDGKEVGVEFDGEVGASGTVGMPGRIRGRDGRIQEVMLHPVRGAVGLAVVDRLALAAKQTDLPVVLVAAVVGRELQAALVARRLGYLDMAGNCHLELHGGNVTVHIEGRRRPARPAGIGSLRAAGYQALFALLVDESMLERTVREIAAAAGVSRHAVHSLVERLRDEGVLLRAGRSRHVFAAGGREKCIDRFTTGWADVLRGNLLVGRFQVRERDPQQVVALLEQVLHAAQVPFGFGGAHGSARWLRHLQSEETVVHVARWDPELVRQLGAVPDRRGPLQVFRTMGALDLASGHADTAHPLLVHAELARSADPRARETAALLLDRLLPGRS
ncbi:MAG: type IV toxin-antitoxin system AbiEi family antitoxin [Planctomycetota bacterium]